MASDCTKANENIYFRCRKKASKYNERLRSREGASELLGVSVSSLADYELGNTKVVPVDKVNLMADLYNAPELKNHYCLTECPIGSSAPISSEVITLERAALKLMKNLDDEKVEEIKDRLVEISVDGKISGDEVSDMTSIIEYLDKIAKVASELKTIGLKLINEETLQC